MKKLNTIIIILVAVIFTLLNSTTEASGHSLIIEPVEDGLIKVYYDEGGFSPDTEVFVLDAMENLIHSGKLDENGYFDYSLYPGAFFIAVDDGKGIQAEWQIGKPFKKRLPKIPAAGIVWIGFAGIALLFKKRMKIKSLEY